MIPSAGHDRAFTVGGRSARYRAHYAACADTVVGVVARPARGVCMVLKTIDEVLNVVPALNAIGSLIG